MLAFGHACEQKKVQRLLLLAFLLSTLLLVILSFCSPRSSASTSLSCRLGLGVRQVGSYYSAASCPSGIITGTMSGISMGSLAIALVIITTTTPITPMTALTTTPNTITTTQSRSIFLKLRFRV